MSTSAEWYDLTSDIPQVAVDLYNSKPDIRTQYSTVSAVDEGYDNRSGDLSTLIASAAANNQVVDLEDGTYEMESSVVLTSGIAGIVGHSSASARIYYTGTDVTYLFDVNGVDDLVMEGVTFDISETTADGFDSDVGILRSVVNNAGWFHDVELFGKRHRWQDLNNDGTLETVGGRFTFRVEASATGTNLINECHFDYGGTNHADEVGTIGHAIGPNADPPHEGLNVWRKTTCEEFQDNGFYVSNSPGPNVLWDCEAVNNSASQFRLSWNDTVVGGRAEVTDLPEGRLGTCLEVDAGNNIEVIGLEIDAVADYGNEAIQIRDQTEQVTLDRVVLHTQGNPPLNPVRLSTAVGTNLDATVKDCYWFDESVGSSAQVLIRDADVVANNNWRLRSDTRDFEIDVETGSTLVIDGVPYDPGTYTAAELGLEDPLPLPTLAFEPEPTDGGGSEGDGDTGYTPPETNMPLNINTNSELVENSESFQAVDVGQAVQSVRGYAIADGCEVSKSAQMTVSTAPGTFYVAGQKFIDQESQTVQLDAGSVQPRKDLLFYDEDGVLTFRKGTPAEPEGPSDVTYATEPFQFWQPSPPDHTDIEGTPVAEVSLESGATDFNELRDLRSRRTFADLVGFRVSADRQLLLPQYDALIDAPSQERSLIIISGAGTDSEGIYRHDGTAYQRISGAGGLSALDIETLKDWGGYGITNVGDFDAASVKTPDLHVTEGRGLIGSTGRHTQYGITTSPEEIARYSLEADEKLIVNRLDVKMKGGGTNTNFTADIYDADQDLVLASTSSRITAGAEPLGESSAGATILLRYTNETESNQDVCISVLDTVVSL